MTFGLIPLTQINFSEQEHYMESDDLILLTIHFSRTQLHLNERKSLVFEAYESTSQYEKYEKTMFHSDMREDLHYREDIQAISCQHVFIEIYTPWLKRVTLSYT